MDTSPEYIKMCKEARGIQETWKITRGDSYYISHQDVVILFDDDIENICGWADDLLIEVTWLPRQDQLQNMVEWDWLYKTPQNQINSIYNTFSSAFGTKKQWGQFTSHEQLWLAFVMYTKFKKQWNGKTWREIQ